jgi:hypothetical protein
MALPLSGEDRAYGSFEEAGTSPARRVILRDTFGNSPALNDGGSDGRGVGTIGLNTVPLLHVFNGASWDRARGPVVFRDVAGTITAGVGSTIWTPASGKKIRLMGWMLSLSVAGAVLFGDNSITPFLRTPDMAAGVGLAAPPLGNGLLLAAANNVLKIDVTATGVVRGFVFGCEE